MSEENDHNDILHTLNLISSNIAQYELYWSRVSTEIRLNASGCRVCTMHKSVFKLTDHFIHLLTVGICESQLEVGKRKRRDRRVSGKDKSLKNSERDNVIKKHRAPILHTVRLSLLLL